jgi:23S rRNA pseudouridine1911/1915/1917 synthase
VPYAAGVAKPDCIELPGGVLVPILYEDRCALAIDKPAGWMLAPTDWDKTGRNLPRELMLSIHAGEHWARARNLRYLRHVHRLDAETSGVLLLAKSPGALRALSLLFETREVKKKYLALVHGAPKVKDWTCRSSLAPEPGTVGRMRVDNVNGKPAETQFLVLEIRPPGALVEAVPVTGRTHQIRVHLAAGGHPVVGDAIYGRKKISEKEEPLALRAVELCYIDPFQKRQVRIIAPAERGEAQGEGKNSKFQNSNFR